MENIVIKNKKELEDKIEIIKKDGAENIHVVSDFDRTLTYGSVNKRKVPSLMAVLRSDDFLGEDYKKRAHELYEHYHKIEVDPQIPYLEKKEKMKEWWEKHIALLIEKKLKKEHLEVIAKSNIIVFRKGIDTFLKLLKERNIPIVIFSASGCGEAVEFYFKERGLDYNNILFFINRFYWSEDGVAIKSKSPRIHAFNKDETLVREDESIYSKIKDRKNILLLGDSMGDSLMAEGFDYNILLKVGFLNSGYNTEEELENYLGNYDVVVKGDSDFKSLYNNILKKLF